MNCKLKLHSKGFGAEPVLKISPDACFRFSTYLSAIFPEIVVGRKKHFCRQMYGKF